MLALNYDPSNYAVILYQGKKHDNAVAGLTPPTNMEKVLVPVRNRVNRVIPHLVEVLFVIKRK